MKSLPIFVTAAFGLSALTLSAACNRENKTTVDTTQPAPGPAEGQTTVTERTPAAEQAAGAQVQGANKQAIASIVSARCARELRCNNFGADKKYATEQDCSAKLTAEKNEDLNDCPAGIDQKELAECLEEIRNDGCGNPLDTLGRLAACRESDLCKNVAVP